MEDQNLTAGIDSMPELDLSTVYALKDCLGKLEGSLITFEKTIKISTNTDQNQQDFSGDKIVDLFGECGISGQNSGAICKAVNDVIESLSVLSLHGGMAKGKGLTKMAELIELLFMDGGETRSKMKSYYRFHVERKMNSKSNSIRLYEN